MKKEIKSKRKFPISISASQELDFKINKLCSKLGVKSYSEVVEMAIELLYEKVEKK